MKTKRFYIVGAILLGLCTIFTCIALGFGLSHAVKKASADENNQITQYEIGYMFVPTAYQYGKLDTGTYLWGNVAKQIKLTITQNENGLSFNFKGIGINENTTINSATTTTIQLQNFEGILNSSSQGDYVNEIKFNDGSITPDNGYWGAIEITSTGTFNANINQINLISVQIVSESTELSKLNIIINYEGAANATTVFSWPIITDEFSSTPITVWTRTPEWVNTENNNAIYQAGYNAGVQSQQGNISNAYNQGYNAGYAAGTAGSTNLGNILLSAGGVPFETLKSIFDFDLLGINISSLIMSILTAAVAIWLVKLFI